jgi:hypothetical protein
VIYINPPYAEGDSHSENKNIRSGVAITHVYNIYKEILGEVISELFIQFLGRIYNEISNCTIATFSTLKYLNSPKSIKFRSYFKAKAESGFISIGKSFDNVIGNFPIGFIIWNLRKNKEIFQRITLDVYDQSGNYSGKKIFENLDNKKYLNEWLKLYYDKNKEKLGVIGFVANDFQNQKLVFLSVNGRGHHETNITNFNLVEITTYFSVRHCIEHTWINHNDQFLFPNDELNEDLEFQNNCLAYSLFHEKNLIKSKDGTNHWIPFTEKEVNARAKFESSFMTDFIKGKLKAEPSGDLFSEPIYQRTTPLVFSPEATAVFDAGRELWKYYHSFKAINVNASLYDIREHFQGRNEKGKMNNKSEDQTYMQLITELRAKLKHLANKIAPKVYEYGFLKE